MDDIDSIHVSSPDPDSDRSKLLSKLVTQLEEAVQCAICLGQLTDPRILHCKHSFCLFCLHNLYRAKGNPSAVVCPNCKQETVVDQANGIEGLERNKDMGAIAKISAQLTKLVEKSDFSNDLQEVKGSVISEQQEDNGIPEKIGIAFRITPNQAAQRLRAWFPTLKNCTLDLPQAMTNVTLDQKFCPVYEFKITANSKFSVRVSLVNHQSHNCTGDHGGQYTVLIYASDKLEEMFRRELQTFAVDVLQDEDLTAYIDEKRVEILPKSIDRESARSDAQLRVQEIEKEACGASILQRHRGAYAISNLVCSTTCMRELVSQRLFPIYLGSYTYKNKVFKFIVNGVTGDVYGEYPESKILSTMKSLESFGKFALTVVALIAFLWFLSIRQQEQGRYAYHM